jgi:SAM-dependent methyltransferase
MKKQKPAKQRTIVMMLVRLGLGAIAFYLVLFSVLVLLNFPSATDGAPPEVQTTAGVESQSEAFYAASYDAGSDDAYIEIARKAAAGADVEGKVKKFIRDYSLENKRILEVGAGSGLLQDLVTDYTGLDIAPTAARFFHKPFVQASVTDMPFADNEFDGVWSVWVLEHVTKPERALKEIRRVVHDGGLIFLAPAWNCDSWAAEGYEVRPYGDFGWLGKLTKTSIPVRRNVLFRLANLVPIRLARLAWWDWAKIPTTLRYHGLSPNYQKYWVPDGDAVNSIDCYETYLWFLSRGDQCLNCATPISEVLSYNRWPMILRVKKAHE